MRVNAGDTTGGFDFRGRRVERVIATNGKAGTPESDRRYGHSERIARDDVIGDQEGGGEGRHYGAGANLSR